MKRSRRNKERLEERRVEAAGRQADAALLTPKERLARLDARLGKGVGAAKERAKLAKMLEAGFKPAAAATVKQVLGVQGQPKTGAKKAGKKGKAHRKPVEFP